MISPMGRPPTSDSANRSSQRIFSRVAADRPSASSLLIHSSATTLKVSPLDMEPTTGQLSVARRIDPLVEELAGILSLFASFLEGNGGKDPQRDGTSLVGMTAVHPPIPCAIGADEQVEPVHIADARLYPANGCVGKHDGIRPHPRDQVPSKTLEIRTFVDSAGGCLWRGRWCPGTESNRRHRDFQSRALPTELPGPLLPRWARRAYRGRLAALSSPSSSSNSIGRPGTR